MVNQMWYIHIMEYQLALERNEILSQATIWLNLEGTVLSEVSQSKRKKKYYTIPLT